MGTLRGKLFKVAFGECDIRMAPVGSYISIRLGHVGRHLTLTQAHKVKEYLEALIHQLEKE